MDPTSPDFIVAFAFGSAFALALIVLFVAILGYDSDE